MKFSKSGNYTIGFLTLIIFYTGLESLGVPVVPKVIAGTLMWIWVKGLIERDGKIQITKPLKGLKWGDVEE